MRMIGALLLTLLIAGCAGPARQSVPPLGVSVARTAPVGQKAASLATSLVGTPYVYGGSAPTGFDCSGLVYYVFQQLGVAVPRTAAEQRAQARPVTQDHLQPGDLLFFYTPKDHVGIFVGGDQFVHAPATGRSVTVARMNSPFFILGYAGAGRFP